MSSIDSLVVVMAGGHGTRLEPLTIERNKPAVPFGGKYRLVDIVLSNAINSGSSNILVLTQGRDYSFNRHIDAAWVREYGTVTRHSPQESGTAYLGDADAVRQALGVIRDSCKETVIVAPGDHVVKMDFRPFENYLLEKDADIVISLIEKPLEDAAHLGSVAVDGDFRIMGFMEKSPDTPFRASDKEHFYASMGIYGFKTKTLIRLLSDFSGVMWGSQIIPYALQEDFRVFGYPFSSTNKIPGIRFDPVSLVEIPEKVAKDSTYWEDVGRIDDFHRVHMDLVAVDPRFNIHSPINQVYRRAAHLWWPIYGEGRESLGPGKIIRGGTVQDTIMCEGVILSNTSANQCVISPGVHVEDSELVRTIVFEGAVIKGCRIHNAIIEKGANLSRIKLGVNGTHPDSVIHVTQQGISVVPRVYGTGGFNRIAYEVAPK